MALPPRESGRLIASLATHVKILNENVPKFGDILAEEIKSGKLSIEKFGQSKFHPKPEDPWCLDWLFIADTLNFCFWTREGQPKWTVEGQTGYFALCAALNRAIREKVDILNPKVYSKITEKELLKVFRGDTDVQVPLIKERVKCLKEVGERLLEKYDGSFANVVKEANQSSVKLLNLVVSNFECYRDEANYRGHKIAIYKRVQILIGDIWACYKNKGIGHFKDIKEITMFADYRIPQPLIYFNVMKYSDELLKILRNGEILEHGCEMEVEIRACSIRAVELLTEYVAKKLGEGYEVNDIIIDHFLWDFRREHAEEIVQKDIPFHKTLSVYY